MPRHHHPDSDMEGNSFSINNPEFLDLEGLTDEERWALMQLLGMDIEEE